MRLDFSGAALTFVVAQALKIQARQNWWRYAGSNRRPPACKAGALPAELYPHIKIKRVQRPSKLNNDYFSRFLTLDVKQFLFQIVWSP